MTRSSTDIEDQNLKFKDELSFDTDSIANSHSPYIGHRDLEAYLQRPDIDQT